MNNSLRAGLGAGTAAGAFLLTPDKLITPDSLRHYQSLFRVLYRNRVPEEVPYGYGHAFEQAFSVSFKLQFCPILT